VSCQGGRIDRSSPPILVLGLAQADVHLISDEILSLFFQLVYFKSCLVNRSVIASIYRSYLYINNSHVFRLMSCSRPV
jgi:hypothetical protein